MGATIKYPNNINDLKAYMVFVRHTHEGYGATVDSLRNPDKFQLSTSIGNVIGLPIPNNLSDSTSAVWTDENDTSIIGTLASSVATKISPKAKQEIVMKAGQTTERHVAMMFQGMAPKSYTWSWDLSPRNSSEATQINQIIREFQEAQLPSITGGELYRFPDMITIKAYGVNNIAYLPCVITNVSAEYSPDGLFQIYKDGNVPNLRLSVSFTEITSRNRETQKRLMGGAR